MKTIRGIFSAIRTKFLQVRKFFSGRGKQVGRYVDANPYRSFYIALGVLVLLIVVSNILGTPNVAPKKEAAIVKDVQLYTIGTSPKMSVLAQVEKSGVLTITALTPGVVSYITPALGQSVSRGQNLLGLSSNYQGGNTASLSRQLAQTQYQNAVDTEKLQKEIIGAQRELAQKSDLNADQMRLITNQSISATQGLVSLNSEIITGFDASIADLEATNVGGSNDALILSTKQLKSQFVAGLNAAKQGLAIAELTSPDGTTAATLSDLGRDAATRQLDLQEKMIALGIEIAKIQLQIAQVVEGMMYPAAPFAGTVERIFVKVGEAVNQGTPLFQLAGDSTKKSVIAVAYVSADVAGKVSKTEESVIRINGVKALSALPIYVSREAVSGSLHAVYYVIPPEFAAKVTENGFISIELPIGYMSTTAAAPFIPIDSVYQTKDANFVYVERSGKAESISVDLGNVFGSYVEVTRGLSASDKVIVNRNIIAGDRVKGMVK